MQKRQRYFPLIIASLLFGGCQSFTTVLHNPFSKVPDHVVEQPVAEMICIWEQAEGIGLDNKPTRGFGGQIMFFSSHGSEPVPVNGDIEIYLFDDFGTPEEQAIPLHTFRFQKEAFQAFKTETNLGLAYQLFLPYVRKSNFKANCSLRVKVNPSDGHSIYSKMAAVSLSGPDSPQAIAREKRERDHIQLASAKAESPIQPTQPVSREQTAAYFGANSLPKSNDVLDGEKRRLKSALSEVVHNQQVTPQRQMVAPEIGSSNSRPAMQKHPLLED